MGAAVESGRIDYHSLPFEELIREERRLVLEIHNDMIKGDRLHKCISSISPLQSDKALRTIQDLHAVLEEVNVRRKGMKSTLLGLPHRFYLVTLKLGVHSAFFSSITLDFASIFVDCKTAEYIEIASIICATAAVSLTIINQWAEGKHERHRQDKAKLQNCSTEQLEGVKLLDRFLTSFTQLVKLVQSERETRRAEVLAFRSGSSSSNLSANSRAVIENIIGGAGAGSKQPSKKELVKTCISRLGEVPDYLLEGHTGENAEEIRAHWIDQITKMANIRFVFPEGGQSSFLRSTTFQSAQLPGAGLHSAHANDDAGAVTIEIPEDLPEDLDKLSLHKLTLLYKVKIAEFSRQFNLELYLSSLGVDEASLLEQPEEVVAQKEAVSAFVDTLKKLQEAIKKRKDQYRTSDWFPCISPKRRLELLYGAKHATTVIFFGATATSGVTHCVEGFGIRDVGKIIAVISGIITEVLEGVCSWASARESNAKIQLAHMIKADQHDVKGIDALDVFINRFLEFGETVREVQQLKRLYLQPRQVQGLDGDSPRRSIKKELNDSVKNLKYLLAACNDALETIDTTFLENFVKGNGNNVKAKWHESLHKVYKKVTEDITAKRNMKGRILRIREEAFQRNLARQRQWAASMEDPDSVDHDVVPVIAAEFAKKGARLSRKRMTASLDDIDVFAKGLFDLSDLGDEEETPQLQSNKAQENSELIYLNSDSSDSDGSDSAEDESEGEILFGHEFEGPAEPQLAVEEEEKAGRRICILQ